MQQLRPSLAAVLIVRDETANLPACLRSLADVVDEIHVHDTGSTDGTPELAVTLGAAVTTGDWTGDFAAARNAALATCSTEWVLSVDADELVLADPAGLRDMLRHTGADVFEVEIDNASDEMPYTHRAERLFRPSAARWCGRVHEWLAPHARHSPAGGLQTEAVPRALLAITHLGYESAQVRRLKSVRNANIAQAALDELIVRRDRADPALVARTLLDLGRSFVGAARQQDAVDAFESVRELFPGTPEWTQATDFLTRLVLGAGHDEVSLALTAQLRDVGAPTRYCDWLEAQALAQLGQVERAATLLHGVDEVVDTAGRRYDPASLRALKDLMDQLQRAGG